MDAAAAIDLCFVMIVVVVSRGCLVSEARPLKLVFARVVYVLDGWLDCQSARRQG